MKNPPSKAQVIGELVCECGRCAYVEQTKRKGGFLQVRCSECGVDQRTGDAIQKRWRDTMKEVGYYQNDEKVAAYGAVSVAEKQVSDTKTDTIDDSINSTPDTIPETSSKPQPVRSYTIKKKGETGGMGVLVGLGVFVVSVGGAAILSELMKAR